MIRHFLNVIKSRSGLLKQLMRMADTVETAQLGEKRAATSPTPQKSKKKKEHVVALGDDIGRKRKVALLVAYNGDGYYGVQINRGFRTIESELFSALVKAECVPQDHVDNTTKMWFQRGSRTDKGVSAVGQVFSLKMVIVPDLVTKLNENLPGEIRALGYVRTTNGFDSKNFCCGRTYMYMTPTFAFAPLEKFITDEYRITDDRLEQVRSILKLYVGTHKFHNFTSGVKYEQASASRYIINFECSAPYVREGIEFVTLRVRGQSFMLHQIRKMIGLMIAILRGYCTETVITKSWMSERVDIPKAPGLGLVLEALHFDGYNKKFGSDGVHAPLEWSAHQTAQDNFKEEYIISHIVQQEKKDRVMLTWLQTLQFHNFDVTRPEGPQKPWVKTAKLLLETKSKDNTEDSAITTTNDSPCPEVISADSNSLAEKLDSQSQTISSDCVEVASETNNSDIEKVKAEDGSKSTDAAQEQDPQPDSAKTKTVPHNDQFVDAKTELPSQSKPSTEENETISNVGLKNS